MQAYRRIPLTSGDFEHGILFNPTKIQGHITTFLKEHALSHAFISLAVSGPSIKEEIIAHCTAKPTEQELGINPSHNEVIDYTYLYPTDTGSFTFYVCSIERGLLLQYQLLAMASSLNLVAVTTENMALLNAYKYLEQPTFRHSQLAVAMKQANNCFENLITDEIIGKRFSIISKKCSVPPTERSHLLTALGLVVVSQVYATA